MSGKATAAQHGKATAATSNRGPSPGRRGQSSHQSYLTRQLTPGCSCTGSRVPKPPESSQAPVFPHCAGSFLITIKSTDNRGLGCPFFEILSKIWLQYIDGNLNNTSFG